MNKKQLIFAWLMGIAICVTILFYPKKYLYIRSHGEQSFLDEPYPKALPVIQWAYVIPICLSIVTIGGLLIYTLRDKKK